jgi:hypothetical protein
VSLPDAQRKLLDLISEAQNFFSTVQRLPDTPEKQAVLNISRALDMNLRALSMPLGLTMPASQIVAIGPVKPVCPYCGRPFP